MTPEQDDRRVLIVDDHSTFRLGLCALLGSEPGIAVVGEAASGPEAVAAAAALRPDVIVMDLSLPGIDGIQATEQILKQAPEIGVLVLTMFEDDGHLLAAMRVGARGYVLKTARHQEIVRAIHAVGDGEVIFGQRLAAQVLAIFADPCAHTAHTALLQLTAREREVLSLIVRGEGNPAIARILVVSPKTVRNYVTSIFRKLDVGTRDQAVKRAHEAGLG